MNTVAKRVFASVSDVIGRKLEQRADEEGRSLSNLISYLLEREMEDWEPSEPPESKPKKK